ncbi:uncharacterized protein H6S33_009147 [Morchella sextelata]|uniref:uncharacterized protein n=1 Tax=Morchella sextelata TaxID=1174677 RepID=UPI001D03E1C6|nr:uncharacterized protein H6S33_009147 [Morchella sextelata]KAH0612767.1 hypothetical protein H6S33_009147 [Morchella sextelata]
MHLRWASLPFFAAVVVLAASGNQTVKRIGAGDIPFDQQTYDFSPENRCALLSHQSTVLKNDDHHLLVIEGGMSKFKFIWKAEVVEVLDLNPYTFSIDLTQEFDPYTWTPSFQTRKPLKVPVVNRFGMWVDSSQDVIYIQGGHFYTASKWNESSYSPEKADIPDWSLWRFDVRSGKRAWEDVTGDYGWKVERALAGAVVSIPKYDLSFYGGGITNSRTSSETPMGLSRPQVGMLVYDHTTSTMTNETFFGDEEGYGYWNGRMLHLPIGCGKGYLISFVPERARAGTFLSDDGSVGEKTGEAVVFNYAMIYDLDKKIWFNQSTTFFDGEKPIVRTRFCGAVVYGEETNTWEVWIHGGMSMDGESGGIDEIWTKVPIPFGNSHLRGHTCHAVGEQLLIVGGYPPGEVVDEAAPCDNQLVKVFNMRNPGWKSRYELNTVYKTPQQVIVNAGLNLTGNRSPRKGWADKGFGAAFDACVSNSSTVEVEPALETGAVAAIVFTHILRLA